jgi:hypothetical protein
MYTERKEESKQAIITAICLLLLTSEQTNKKEQHEMQGKISVEEKEMKEKTGGVRSAPYNKKTVLMIHEE